MSAAPRRCAALMIGLLPFASGCGDGTGPSRDTIEGTYVLSGVFEESACAPAPRPTGGWTDELPPIGTQLGAVWQVSRTGSSVSVTGVPEPSPPDEAWRFTAPLATDMTFQMDRIVIDGTVSTDDGDLDLILEESVSGSFLLEPTPRLTARHEITERLTLEGTSTVFTTCIHAIALSGPRS